LVLGFALLGAHPSAKAAGFLAGELSYSCTNPALQAYEFDLYLYADCQSVTGRPNQILMDYNSTCLNGDLNLVLSDSSIVLEPCQSSNSCCNGNVPGCQQAIKQYHYRGSINNLPACGDWVFSAFACCRSQLITNTLNPGNYNLYLEAYLDNLSIPSNSNPETNSQPWIMACEGELIRWSPNATDPDSDSLAFELVVPEADVLGSPTPVAYTAGFSPNAPVTTSGPFLIDGHSGELSFTATSQSSGITSMLISEYRNGVLIGQSRKDIFIWVRQCSNDAPIVQAIQTAQSCIRTDSLSFGFCPNTAGQFSIQFSDPNLDTVIIEEQISSALPGAMVLNQNQNLTLSWAPAWQDTGEYFLPISIKDDGCTYPRQRNLLITIQVGKVQEAGPDTATYCGQPVQLNAPLGSNWQWTPSSGLSNDTSSSPLANPSTPRWYTVSNSCGTDSVFVDVLGPDYSIDAGEDFALCSGLQDTLSVTITPAAPHYQINWLGNVSGQSGDQGLLSAGDQGKVLVEVADGRGCSLRDSLIVTRNSSVFHTQVQTQSNLCAQDSNGSILVNTGGLSPFLYQLNGGSLQSNNQFLNLPANSYIIRVVDSAKCDTSLRVQVNAPAPLALSNIQIDSPDCYGQANGQITVQASGGIAPYQYNFNQQGFQLNTVFNSLTAGTYSMVFRDLNGCIDTQTIILPQPDSLNLDVVTIDSASCQPDGGLLVNVSGGNAPYQLTLGSSPLQSGVYLGNLSAGNYNLRVEDQKGCLKSQQVFIPSLDSLELQLLARDVLCFGQDNGQIVVTGNGGTAPYGYQLNALPFQASNTFTGLDEGSYQVTIQDSLGCTASGQVRVNEPAALQLSTIITDALCHDQPGGSIQLSGSGGIPGYNYLLVSETGDSTLYSSAQIDQLIAGRYLVVLSDQNNCRLSDSFNIQQPPPTQYQSMVDSSTCFDSEDGSISLIGLPPAGHPDKLPFSYALNGAAFGPNGFFGNLPPGDYPVVSRDNQGCLDTLFFTVSSPPKLAVGFNPHRITLGQGETGVLQPEISGVLSRGYTIAWTPAIGLDCDDCTNPSVGIFESRTYLARVTDHQSGCVASDTIHVEIREPKPVFVPNAFTPNGEGVNETLFVYGNDIKQMHLQVFNRWGEKVFESKSQNIGWSGNYKGQPVKNGVYQYHLAGTYLSGETFELTGNVTVIR
jgi:gliding motility-associated-like protein